MFWSLQGAKNSSMMGANLEYDEVRLVLVKIEVDQELLAQGLKRK